MARVLKQRFHPLNVSKGGDFPSIWSYFNQNGFRIGIWRKIGKTEIDRAKNKLTRASHAPGSNHSRVPRASVTRLEFPAVAGRGFGSNAVARVDRGLSVRFGSPRGYRVG